MGNRCSETACECPRPMRMSNGKNYGESTTLSSVSKERRTMMPPSNRRAFVTWMAGLIPTIKVLPQAILRVGASRGAPAYASKRTAGAYRCPPCGLPCDQLRFDQPGTCPQCGMTLIPLEGGGVPTVAILLYNGVQLIDIAGPWEVFGTAGMLIHTVAETADPVTLVFGEHVIPDYTFANSPKADVLLIPGGGYGQVTNNARALDWVRGKANDVSYVMTVCTGAFIAGQAGLLAGQTATATHGMIDDLLDFPGTKVVHDQRYVDNGKIMTTAGLSSGIDGALHLVSKMLGPGAAQSVALGMEYRWDPDKPFVRAMLADRFLPDGLKFGNAKLRGAEATLISTAGDTDRWTFKMLVSEPRSRSAIVALLRDRIGNAPRNAERMNLERSGASTSQSTVQFTTAASNDSRVDWRFMDDRRQHWRGSAIVEDASDHMGKYYVTLTLMRA